MNRIAIQGGTGSFHEQAARLFYGNHIEVLPCNTFEELFTSMNEGKAPGADKLTLPDEISCGESGLLARVMISIATLDYKEKRITGHGTLLARPVDTVLPPLSQLGVTIQSPHGHLPLTLKGPLKGGKEIQLEDELSVNKSFPDFWDTLDQLKTK